MDVKRIPPDDWLAALIDPSVEVRLEVCRLWHRRHRFDNRRQQREHHFCCFVEQGAMAIHDGDQLHPLAAGSLHWVQPGPPRGVYHDRPTGLRHCNLRILVRHRRRLLACAEAPQQVADAWQCQPLLRAIHELDGVEAPHREARLRGLFAALFGQLLALAREETQPGLSPAQRQAVLALVRDGRNPELRPADLARAAQLSPDWFARRFRASFGMSPRSWLVRERMRQAAVLLEEQSDPIVAIARSLGFDSPQLFNRQFKVVHGCTPGVFRQRILGGDRHRL